MCLAVRKVDIVVQRVVLALDTYHIKEVNICRGSTNEAVNACVTHKHIVDEQRVGSRDISVNGIVVNAVAVSVITIVAGKTHLVVEHPCRWVVGLDSRLHQQCAAEHVGDIAIESLYILRCIRETHIVLIGVRINNTCAELHELGVHGVVYTCSVTGIVRTCTFECTLLLEIVESHVVCTVGTTTTEVYVVVLTGTGLEHLLKPVGVGVVLELILACGSVEAVSTGESSTRVGTSLTDVVAVHVCIHHVINIAWNLVNTEISSVVDLQRLVLLTVLSGDDDHTVGSTRTVDSTCGSILEHLDGLDIIW